MKTWLSECTPHTGYVNQHEMILNKSMGVSTKILEDQCLRIELTVYTMIDEEESLPKAEGLVKC